LFAARKPSDDSLHMPADENSQLPATTFPTNWTVTHTKADEEEAALQLRPDGSGSLTRAGGAAPGHWRIETREKKGERCRYLHFHARDGADGLVYMGALDEAGSAVPKGSVWRGTRKVGGFQMRAAAAAPPPPAMASLPPLPPPLAAVPATARYVPGFLSEEDEQLLLRHIRLAPTWRAASGNGRRVQNWGGRPGEQNVAEGLPAWLQPVVDAVVRCGAWPDPLRPPNHVLINEYQVAGCGLDPHTDGPLYSACVGAISLESDVVLDLHDPHDPQPRAQLLLRRRSLNVLADAAYELHHGIGAREQDTLGPLVANLQPGDAIGDVVTRAPRVSIVLVHKLATDGEVAPSAAAPAAAGPVDDVAAVA
tara:strand:- start:131 stop:1228 length:1098 start_codon:yes stop_codon:yes gene_type:complete